MNDKEGSDEAALEREKTRKIGRPIANDWKLFSNDAAPQNDKETLCKHCNQLVLHHGKRVRVLDHLHNKCAVYMNILSANGSCTSSSDKENSPEKECRANKKSKCSRDRESNTTQELEREEGSLDEEGKSDDESRQEEQKSHGRESNDLFNNSFGTGDLDLTILSTSQSSMSETHFFRNYLDTIGGTMTNHTNIENLVGLEGRARRDARMQLAGFFCRLVKERSHCLEPGILVDASSKPSLEMERILEEFRGAYWNLDLGKVVMASTNLATKIHRTALLEAKELGALNSGKVYLKLECDQLLGSYKVRGYFNRISTLETDQPFEGFVWCSGCVQEDIFAKVLEQSSMKGVRFANREMYVKALKDRGYDGIENVTTGSDNDINQSAKIFAAKANMIYFDSQSDAAVIAGNATLAKEILEQFQEEIDYVFVSKKLTELVEVVTFFFKSMNTGTKIVPCSQSSDEMDRTVFGTRNNHDVLVSSQDVREAITCIEQHHHKRLGDHSGTAIAGFRKVAPQIKGSRVVIIATD